MHDPLPHNSSSLLLQRMDQTQRICQGASTVQSQVAKVDLASGEVVRRFKAVGVNSHGLVAWRDRFVILSSQEAALVTLDPTDGSTSTIWAVRSAPHRPAP